MRPRRRSGRPRPRGCWSSIATAGGPRLDRRVRRRWPEPRSGWRQGSRSTRSTSRSPAWLAWPRRRGARASSSDPIQANLEEFPLPSDRYAVVVNCRYLQRPLFPALRERRQTRRRDRLRDLPARAGAPSRSPAQPGPSCSRPASCAPSSRRSACWWMRKDASRRTAPPAISRAVDRRDVAIREPSIEFSRLS